VCLALQIGLHRSTSEVFRCADGSPPCEVQGQGKLVAGSVQANTGMNSIHKNSKAFVSIRRAVVEMDFSGLFQVVWNSVL